MSSLLRLLKASSVGAKAVYDPSCLSRSVSSAVSISDRKILQIRSRKLKKKRSVLTFAPLSSLLLLHNPQRKKSQFLWTIRTLVSSCFIAGLLSNPSNWAPHTERHPWVEDKTKLYVTFGSGPTPCSFLGLATEILALEYNKVEDVICVRHTNIFGPTLSHICFLSYPPGLTAASVGHDGENLIY